MNIGKMLLKVTITRKPGRIRVSFPRVRLSEETGRVFIVEEMESAESGKQFLAKNPNYVMRLGWIHHPPSHCFRRLSFLALGRPFNLSQKF